MAAVKLILALCLLLVGFAYAQPIEEPKGALETDKAALDGATEVKTLNTKTVLTEHENGTNSTSVEVYRMETDSQPKNQSEGGPANTRMAPPAAAPAAAEARNVFECYQCSTLLGDSLADCKKPPNSMLKECGAVRRCHSVAGTLTMDDGKIEEMMVIGCDSSSALDIPHRSIIIPDTDWKADNDCKAISVAESIQKNVNEGSEQLKYNFKGDVCNCNTSRCNRVHGKMHSGKDETIVHTHKPNAARVLLPSAAILSALVSVAALI